MFRASANFQGTTGNLRVVTGEDLYSFLDAVDFLESMPQDPSLIIIVHSLAQLQSNIHPQHFQRLDEALGSLLRFGGAGSPLVLCAVDRDQNTLKSTGLCTEQWFFPFNATEWLRIIWPKIPTCPPLPGPRDPDQFWTSPQVFQLTRVQAAEAASSTWLQLTPLMMPPWVPRRAAKSSGVCAVRWRSGFAANQQLIISSVLTCNSAYGFLSLWPSVGMA